MTLRSLEYRENVDRPLEWSLDKIDFGPVNLIVGRNSSGKSRTLSVLMSLATNLTGRRPPGDSGEYNVVFDNGSEIYNYEVAFRDEKIVQESVQINESIYLTRRPDGFGELRFDGFDDQTKLMPFQSPPEQFAAFTRRDSLQHSYLEPLIQWAESVRYYPFAGALGKDVLSAFVPTGNVADDRDPMHTSALFRAGVKEFGKSFSEALVKDLVSLDYNITNIDIGQPTTVRIESPNTQFNCLNVSEEGIGAPFDQISMSNGMYRALAVLINLNLTILRKSAATVLIDDIGEGLDYERSVSFIKIVREKCIKADVQLIMSTNDKFAMNAVPLAEWTVLVRKGNRVTSLNQKNHTELFEDFRFTGLSNFNFFEMNSKGPAPITTLDD